MADLRRPPIKPGSLVYRAMYPDRRPPEKIKAPEYPKRPFEPVPKYVPKKGGLVTQSLGLVQPVSKQRRDRQKERLEPFKQSPKVRKSPQHLAAFNAKRRNKRNSDGFAFDADCVERPDSGAGNSARYEPTRKQKADQKARQKKHEHARRWC